MRSKIIAVAGLFLSLIVACAANPSDSACLQPSDVCSCSCGGQAATGLSSEAKPSCSSWEGQACGDADAGAGLTYTSCVATGTMCWSP